MPVAWCIQNDIMTDLLLSSFFQTILDWDTQIFLAINGWHNSYWDIFMELFSDRFIWIPFYVSFAYVMFRSFPWRVNVVCLLVIALLITINDQMAGHMFRSAVGRLRPANTDNPISPLVHIVHGYRGGRYGFPSAHSANCWSLTIFCYYVFRRHLLSLTMVLWSVVTCWSRLYLGVHYFGDILAGFLLGFVTATIIYYVFQRGMHRVTETYKPYQVDAPHMYVPVIVCWCEVLVMIILSFDLNVSAFLP